MMHESVDVSTYWPAEQTEQTTLPLLEERPEGHFKHVVASSRTPRYSSGPQSEHAFSFDAPISVPFFPG
jgi:hypothetical protein